MRRSDREVKDLQKIREVFESSQCCHVGLCDDGKPYVLPLNFGYAEKDGHFTLYFHGANEGRKIDLLQRTHYACAELDCGFELHTADIACKYSAAFRSVIGEGPAEIITDPESKAAALSIIMSHYSKKTEWKFDPAMLAAVTVWKLELDQLQCKEHL